MSKKPLISVVTVSYNAVSTIEQTILSVINQTYPHIEYIIIDGGSTDGTVDIIKKYADKIAYWVSEPDKGIYDAMNKGIKVATGEWINFMNCGDSFIDYNVLDQIKIHFQTNADVIYGNTIIKTMGKKYLLLPDKLGNLLKHLIFCHQSSFVKTKLAIENLFQIKYKYVADYNLFYTLYLQNKYFLYVNIPVANYLTDEGFTASNRMACCMEEYKVNGRKFKIFSKVKLFIRGILVKKMPVVFKEKLFTLLYLNNSRYIEL